MDDRRPCDGPLSAGRARYRRHRDGIGRAAPPANRCVDAGFRFGNAAGRRSAPPRSRWLRVDTDGSGRARFSLPRRMRARRHDGTTPGVAARTATRGAIRDVGLPRGDAVVARGGRSGAGCGKDAAVQQQLRRPLGRTGSRRPASPPPRRCRERLDSAAVTRRTSNRLASRRCGRAGRSRGRRADLDVRSARDRRLSRRQNARTFFRPAALNDASRAADSPSAACTMTTARPSSIASL